MFLTLLFNYKMINLLNFIITIIKVISIMIYDSLGVGIGQARPGFKRPEPSLRLIFEA